MMPPVSSDITAKISTTVRNSSSMDQQKETTHQKKKTNGFNHSAASQ